MNRRAFLTSTGGIALTMTRPVRAAGRKPNIIFFLADDLGMGDLGCYGQERIETPNLDRMAAEGMRFMNHYSGSTVCAPCRATIMTGYHTGHLRTTGQGQVLQPEDVTVAKLLREAGYATGAFGKWGMGRTDSTGAPNKQGFDTWFGFINQGNAHFYYPPYVWDNDQQFVIPENAEGEGAYIHEFFTTRALQFVRDHEDEPFFLYFPSIIPHAELDAPEEDIAHYRGRFDETPYEARHPKDGGGGTADPHHSELGYGTQAEPRAAYAAMVTLLDRDIGRVMALVKELGLDEDTLMLFGSDNGVHAEGGHDPEYFDSNGPLRGIKRDLYDGGIRTPFIARWPGKIEAGASTEHISAYWDFLPTCAEVGDATPPAGIDGISYLPTLLGETERQRQHDALYWEYSDKQAARKGKWKAVRYKMNAKPTPPLELYDLDADIGETKNLAEKYPEIVSEMDAILEKNRHKKP